MSTHFTLVTSSFSAYPLFSYKKYSLHIFLGFKSFQCLANIILQQKCYYQALLVPTNNTLCDVIFFEQTFTMLFCSVEAKLLHYLKTHFIFTLSQNLVKLSLFLKRSYPARSKPATSPTPPQNIFFSCSKDPLISKLTLIIGSLKTLLNCPVSSKYATQPPQ